MPPKPTPKAPAAEYARIYQYITDPSPENAKAADVREFYRQLFKDQFLYEANAENADGYVRGRMVVELKGKHDDWLPAFTRPCTTPKRAWASPTSPCWPTILSACGG